VTTDDKPRLSAIVVAHNEDAQLADCLACLAPVDEIVVVLDRCTDGSKAIADRMAHKVVEGAWPIEGDRHNTGLDTATGDWILEIDADERAPADLFAEIRSVIRSSKPGYYLIPFDNYVGDRLVKYGWGGSWGVGAAARLSSRGVKRWGNQRVHPAVTLTGPKRWLTTPIAHYVDRDFNDMLDRLKRYTDARAADLRDSGEPLPAMRLILRRSTGRFIKCYFLRKGYREGGWGFTIALMAALYVLIAHLKASLEPGPGDAR
jgi:glycosyltransferase involved in cell wall biosynthesis